MGLIISLLINTVAVLAAGYIIPGIKVDNITSAILVAIVLGLLNTFLKPILTLITLFVLFVTSPKHTVRYELESDCNNTRIPAIRKDVENATDDVIKLSKEISWGRAIQMVDSLNQTIKPIK